MNSLPTVRFVAALLMLAPFSAATTLHTVDLDGLLPADFSEIQDAVNAASDGDVIVVRQPLTALYQPVIIDGKSLTLVGVGIGPSGLEACGQACVGLSGFATARTLIVRNLGATQAVVVRGLHFDARSATLPPGGSVVDYDRGPALSIENCAGAVRLEECTFRGEEGYSQQAFPAPPQAFPAAGVVVADAADVAFFRCAIEGGEGAWISDEDFDWFVTDGAPGAIAESSTLSMHDTSCRGGAGGSIDDTDDHDAGDGAAGVTIASSSLLLSGCAVRGGRGGDGDWDVLFGGFGLGGDGGDGLVVASGAAFSLDTSLLGGGPGSDGQGASTGTPGSSLDLVGGTFTPLAGAHRGLAIESPVVAGQGGTIAITGASGDQALLLLSPQPAQALIPAYFGGLLVGAPIFVLGAGAIPATGQLVIPYATPPLGAIPAAVVHAQVVTQGVDARLGEGSVAVVVGHF